MCDDMDVDAPLSVIPQWLDATAIAVGAAAATLVAGEFRDKRLDWLGVAIIGTTSALGGGVVRDLLMGLKPVVMTNEWYLLTALLASFAGMLLQAAVSRIDTLVTISDALALAFFCAIGTAKAQDAGLPILPSILVGTCTAAGGGMIRDVLVGMPVGVLYAGSLYAFAAILGSASFLAATALGVDAVQAMVICGIVTFAIRMASIWFGLSLPEQIALQWPARRGRGGRERAHADGVDRSDEPITTPEEQFVAAAALHAPNTSPIDLIAVREAQARRDAGLTDAPAPRDTPGVTVPSERTDGGPAVTDRRAPDGTD